MRCVFVVPPVSAISTRIAIAPQLPLGHVLVGSELIRHGHQVILLDSDAGNDSIARSLTRVRDLGPDCILVGHPASTIAHPAAMVFMNAVKEQLPHVPVIYGGPFATYNAFNLSRREHTPIDFIVCYEAEKVAAELVDCIACSDDPHNVNGVVAVHTADKFSWGTTTRRASVEAIPPLWDHSWDLSLYRAYGLQSVVIQFSRGCPRTCAYCGQWHFWQNWRHRRVESFVREVDYLGRLGNRVFWMADENCGTNQEVFIELLEQLAKINRGYHIMVSLEPGHVIRDLDSYHLYKEAGISQVMLGVDGQGEFTLGEPAKGFYARDLRRAIEKLQFLGIMVIINDFVPTNRLSCAQRCRYLKQFNADFYNCLHPTPLAGTRFALVHGNTRFCADLRKWDYRHPVIGSSRLNLLKQAWNAKRFEMRLNGASLFRQIVRRRWSVNPLARMANLLCIAVFLWEVVQLFGDTTSLVLSWMKYLWNSAIRRPAATDSPVQYRKTISMNH